MNYYVISFTATINGSETRVGTVGSVSSTTDYKPNLVKQKIIEKYQGEFGNVPVAVVIADVEKVESEVYFEAAKGFIVL